MEDEEEVIYDLPRGSEAPSEDVTSEAGSVCEEERVRKLFQACDADGDGYIDSHDLMTVCRELNLEDSIDELMRELGADESGRISYDEFLRRRLSLRSEIDALRRQDRRTETQRPPQTIIQNREIDYIQTSSENSMGGASGGKHERWEFDSGARDLSPEPHSLQKLVEAAGGSLIASSPSHLLDLANRLHLAALASLKAEVSDVTTRLRTVTSERDILEKTLNKIQLEKMRLNREFESKLEAESQRYEERITELHCVIAELRRKLEHQRGHAIAEDDEEELAEDEEISQDLNYQSEDFSRDADALMDKPEDSHATAGGSRSYTSADMDNRAVEAGQSLADLTECKPASQPAITDLLDEIANQKEEVAKKTEEVERAHSLLVAGRDERERLRKKINELSNTLKTVMSTSSSVTAQQESSSQSPKPHASPMHSLKGSSPATGSPVGGTLQSVSKEETAVTKIAERVRLRRVVSNEGQLSASDLNKIESWSTPVAEQLALLHSINGESSVQELLCRYLAIPNKAPSCTESAAAEEGFEEERIMAQVANLQQLLPLREFELEIDRLRAKSEHLRAQCDVYSMALNESRVLSERLTLLCGKYESNCTALWLALEHSDTAIEAYDVLLALLESELAALVATCLAAGIPAASNCPAVNLAGDPDNPGLALARAGDLRMTAEGVACLLLSRLDRNVESANGDLSGKHHTEVRLWRQGEELRLRSHISRLKGDRARVRSTVQFGLESPHVDPPKQRNPASVAEARKMDLEMAVLMQELMALREEKAELRAKCHILEREKVAMELRLNGQEAHRQAQVAALHSLQQQLKDSENRLSGSIQDIDDSHNKELLDALAREARLKERLQELMNSLETVSRSADIRQQQSNEMINEMKRANSSLTQMLDKCKRKYQARIRKMEHQSEVAVDRHSNQVRMLKQRIAVLESELAADMSSPTPNETSL
ncbi:Hypothetical predicted protein [Cloeon dipterum]|uniref:EF-hand domain-containing protein n=2 Tax=Cloeon dipterum TaxID=197152 RepID=A0A8S1C231_9INSE|nr:Hypothetical predicted protein [Cloeon dipterum]